MLDFDVVKRQIIAEYLKLYGNADINEEWNIKTIISLFRYFYDRYYAILKKEHPHLSSKSISKIIEKVPHIEIPESGKWIDLRFEDYEQMIDGYLETDMNDPTFSHSIAHFMSGNVRLIKFYEVLY